MKQKKNQFELRGWGLATYLAVGIGAIIGIGLLRNRLEERKYEFYTVKKGDEFHKIAPQFDGVSIKSLCDYNPDLVPWELKKGQRIRLGLKSNLKNISLEQSTGVNDVNEVNENDKKLVTNVLYGEAANQSRLGRKIIARMTLNRVREPEYPSSIKDVIYNRLAISCIKDKKNQNWKQATGVLERNEYEEMIYNRCGEDANSILNGERLGIPFEDEIIAYHDTSIKYEDLVAKEKKIQEKWKKKGKRYDGYWMHLEPVVREGDLIFYKEKN